MTDEMRALKRSNDLEHFAKNRLTIVSAIMREAGVGVEEAKATIRFNLAEPLDFLAGTDAYHAMSHGCIPMNGLGLSGMAGTGKTFAISAMVRVYLEEWIRGCMEHADFLLWELRARIKGHFLWYCWPEQANMIRRVMSDQSFDDRAERVVRAGGGAKILVLDDIGAERIKAGATYLDDYATSLLDEIIDKRYRDGLVTFYTTNLSKKGLLDRYGSRLYSRLVPLNPLIVVPTKVDLRVVMQNGRV